MYTGAPWCGEVNSDQPQMWKGKLRSTLDLIKRLDKMDTRWTMDSHYPTHPRFKKDMRGIWEYEYERGTQSCSQTWFLAKLSWRNCNILVHNALTVFGQNYRIQSVLNFWIVFDNNLDRGQQGGEALAMVVDRVKCHGCGTWGSVLDGTALTCSG